MANEPKDLMDRLIDDVAAQIDAMSDEEAETYTIILDYLDTLPPGFFKKSLKELNKHFGGHDDLVVTETVRRALHAQQTLENIFDDMNDMMDSLPETEEEAEELEKAEKEKKKKKNATD